ncbi:MAG: patatin-like phospholipase family protein [Spongiibacteraceae bacterium]
MKHPSKKKKVGLALGSGSARGLAHIGVIQRLQELGVEADIVCGTSAGAIVAACHLTGKLDHFSEWIQSLSNAQVFHYLNVSLTATGGVAHATRLMDFFAREYGNPNIEDLAIPFAAVATDMYRGREVWLQEGSIWQAVRASMALPGVITPVAYGDTWLVDGGLLNPIPISVCRALGADIIIGVDLNSDLVGSKRHAAADNDEDESKDKEPDAASEEHAEELPLFDSPALSWLNSVKEAASNFRAGNTEEEEEEEEEEEAKAPPGAINVMMNSINIMQDRITRSRLAGEPADVLLWPRLSHIGLLDIASATETIQEGRDAVDRMLPAIEHSFEIEGDFRIKQHRINAAASATISAPENQQERSSSDDRNLPA